MKTTMKTMFPRFENAMNLGYEMVKSFAKTFSPSGSHKERERSDSQSEPSDAKEELPQPSLMEKAWTTFAWRQLASTSATTTSTCMSCVGVCAPPCLDCSKQSITCIGDAFKTTLTKAGHCCHFLCEKGFQVASKHQDNNHEVRMQTIKMQHELRLLELQSKRDAEAQEMKLKMVRLALEHNVPIVMDPSMPQQPFRITNSDQSRAAIDNLAIEPDVVRDNDGVPEIEVLDIMD